MRFGESRGFERNEIINNAWPYRDYVIRSLNEDKPFDQFVQEQLAGDVMGGDDVSLAAATTFLVCGPYDDVTNQDPLQAAQIRADTIDDIIRATSEAFLGLTIGCARCHDHKFDPVTQTDYYALYAIFAGVTHGEREVATDAERRQRETRLSALERERAEIHEKIEQLEKQLQERAAAQSPGIERQWRRPPVLRSLTEEVFAPTQAKFIRLVVEGTEGNPSGGTDYRIDEFEVWTAGHPSRNVALTSAGGRATGRSRVAEDFADAYSAELTIDGQFGARWIPGGPDLTIELANEETIDRVSFSSDRRGDAGDHSVATFVSEYRIETSRDGIRWETVATSHDRRPVNDAHRRFRLREAVMTDDERALLAELNAEREAVNLRIAAVPALPKWWIGNHSAATGPFHVFLGGNPQKRGAVVTPGSLSLIPELRVPEADLTAIGAARLALARWLVDRRNPLTPRVLANRVWQYHFGTGIVDTPSDFGVMGSAPTHPELLDWLALQLSTPEAEGGFGWRLKPLHRLIMTSQTYQQSSAARDDALAVDADSRLLWRFPPRRLSAEEIRDSMLSIAGKLNLTMGGPGFRLYRYLQDNVATYVPLEVHGPETWRRAVYHQNARASRVDILTDFDCPDPAFAAPRRAVTTTPLQALTLMNHQFTHDMAYALAERIKREARGDCAAQVERGFALAFGRLPDPVERRASAELITQHGLAAFCRVLLNANEFIYVH